jgi:thiamine kinase-like enzyme
VGTASRLDFAPNVHGWSREERWYEEDYVVGGLECQKPMTSAEFLANYDSQIADVLEKTILLQDPNVVSLPEYVDDVLETARSPRLDAANLKKGHVSRIREFMETTANRLRSQRHRQIYLVFSHGDFSQQNVMRTKRGVRCIDWESARRRSILYDLYNYFFTELHYERTQSNMVSEIPDAVRSMQARLLTKAPSLSQGLTDAALIYLRTYYIERVQTFLERELSNQLLTVVLQSISAFQQYDRELEEVGGWNELNAAGNAEAAR